MLPQIDHQLDQLTAERESAMREAQSVYTTILDLNQSWYARVRLNMHIARGRKESDMRLMEALRHV